MYNISTSNLYHYSNFCVGWETVPCIFINFARLGFITSMYIEFYMRCLGTRLLKRLGTSDTEFHIISRQSQSHVQCSSAVIYTNSSCKNGCFQMRQKHNPLKGNFILGTGRLACRKKSINPIARYVYVYIYMYIVYKGTYNNN